MAKSDCCPFGLPFAPALVLLATGLLSYAGPSPVPKKVLVIHIGWERMPVNQILTKQFEQVMSADRSLEVDFFHEYLDDMRLQADQLHLAESLQKKYFSTGKPDLIITAGPSALRLCRTYSVSHFASVPVVFMLADEHFLQPGSLPPHMTGITMRMDLVGTLELALRLHPATEQVFFIAGTSGSEHAYQQTFQQETAAVLAKQKVTYLNDLSMGELVVQLGRLPERSLVFYLFMFTDSTPAVYLPIQVSSVVAAASNAPVYTPMSTFMGSGIVGGRFFNVEQDAQRAGLIAHRILHGESPRNIPREQTTYYSAVDWRQLQRWRVRENQLPAGTAVLFREPSVWMKYKWPIAVGSLALAAQLVLIAWLVDEGRRRRASESALKALSGHLLSAQEEERARIARELHDGFNQQIALLGISLSSLKRQIPPGNPALVAEVTKQQEHIIGLAEDIRQLSHELHPSILKVSGIDRALQHFCDEFGKTEGLDIDFRSDITPDRVSPETALCLYRIAQESLRNVVKYADTNSVRVSLIEEGTECTLSVVDRGRGFAPGVSRNGGIGLISMQERARALQGTLTIWSKPGQGTVITARVPLEGQSQDIERPAVEGRL